MSRKHDSFDLLSMFAALFLWLSLGRLFSQWPGGLVFDLFGEMQVHGNIFHGVSVVPTVLAVLYAVAAVCFLLRRARVICILASGFACLELAAGLFVGFFVGLGALLTIWNPRARVEFRWARARAEAPRGRPGGRARQRWVAGSARRWTRLSLALVSSVVVFSVTYYTGFTRIGTAHPYAPVYENAAAELAWLHKRVVAFSDEHGRLPNSLEDLNLDRADLLDPWEVPFRYEQTGRTEFRIWSLGADRMVGGSNLDADFDLETAQANAYPSLTEFVVQDRGGYFASCVFAALLTVVVAFLNAGQGSGLGLRQFTALAITALFSFVLAACLATFHVPSGH